MKITWELILAGAGGLVVLYNAGSALLKMTNPFVRLKRSIDDHEERLNKHDEYFTNDNKRINGTEDSNKMVCKCLLALLEHEITGNGIDKLKTTKTELQNFLINK